jgi:hypothetical protein
MNQQQEETSSGDESEEESEEEQAKKLQITQVSNVNVPTGKASEEKNGTSLVAQVENSQTNKVSLTEPIPPLIAELHFARSQLCDHDLKQLLSQTGFWKQPSIVAKVILQTLFLFANGGKEVAWGEMKSLLRNTTSLLYAIDQATELAVNQGGIAVRDPSAPLKASQIAALRDYGVHAKTYISDIIADTHHPALLKLGAWLLALCFVYRLGPDGVKFSEVCSLFIFCLSSFLCVQLFVVGPVDSGGKKRQTIDNIDFYSLHKEHQTPVIHSLHTTRSALSSHDFQQLLLQLKHRKPSSSVVVTVRTVLIVACGRQVGWEQAQAMLQHTHSLLASLDGVTDAALSAVQRGAEEHKADFAHMALNALQVWLCSTSSAAFGLSNFARAHPSQLS